MKKQRAILTFKAVLILGLMYTSPVFADYSHSCANYGGSIWCPNEVNYISPNDTFVSGSIPFNLTSASSSVRAEVVQQSVGVVCTSEPFNPTVGGVHYFQFFNACVLGSGNYYLVFDNGSLQATLSGDSNLNLFTSYTDGDISTRIISVSPKNDEVVSNTVSFNLQVYINQEDFNRFGTWIKIGLHNVDQNVLLSRFSPYSIALFNEFATTSGFFSFSTTTVLPDGNYRVDASISTAGLYAPLDIISLKFPISTSTQFIVNQDTFLGRLSQNSFKEFQQILDGTSSTSTVGLVQSCSPVSNNAFTLFLNPGFSVSNCLSFLFVPDGQLIDSSLQSFRDLAATHFPLGYVTDFIRILSATTSSSTLPSFVATIPPGLPGQGDHIVLSLDHVLDPILTANVGSFVTPEVDSNETFYEFTSFYWSIFVYLSAGLYILRRILGSHIIPKVWGKQNDYQSIH